jgi:hypothetical protein
MAKHFRRKRGNALVVAAAFVLLAAATGIVAVLALPRPQGTTASPGAGDGRKAPQPYSASGDDATPSPSGHDGLGGDAPPEPAQGSRAPRNLP